MKGGGMIISPVTFQMNLTKSTTDIGFSKVLDWSRDLKLWHKYLPKLQVNQGNFPASQSRDTMKGGGMIISPVTFQMNFTKSTTDIGFSKVLDWSRDLKLWHKYLPKLQVNQGNFPASQSCDTMEEGGMIISPVLVLTTLYKTYCRYPHQPSPRLIPRLKALIQLPF